MKPFNKFNLVERIKGNKKKQAQPMEARLPQEETAGYYKLVPGSQTWGFIRQWADEQLKETRARNDSLSSTEIETAARRGKIETLKELLKLPDEPEKKRLLMTEPERYDTFAGY